MSPRVKEAIVAESIVEKDIKEIARSEGTRTLREEGEALALNGITTKEEVLRLTPPD